MPRRKIVGGPEEIEYRLLSIIRQLGKVSGAQALAALGALAALAHLYKVELGEDFRAIVRKAMSNVNPVSAGKYEAPSIPASPGVATGPLEDKKEPLTVAPPSDMFEDLEDKDE